MGEANGESNLRTSPANPFFHFSQHDPPPPIHHPPPHPPGTSPLPDLRSSRRSDAPTSSERLADAQRRAHCHGVQSQAVPLQRRQQLQRRRPRASAVASAARGLLGGGKFRERRAQGDTRHKETNTDQTNKQTNKQSNKQTKMTQKQTNTNQKKHTNVSFPLSGLVVRIRVLVVW